MTPLDEFKLLSRLDFSMAWHGDASDPRYLSSPCPRSSPLQGFSTHEDAESGENEWMILRRLQAERNVPGRSYSTEKRSVLGRRYFLLHPEAREMNRQRCQARRERLRAAKVAA
jgi:hypothetical protein